MTCRLQVLQLMQGAPGQRAPGYKTVPEENMHRQERRKCLELVHDQAHGCMEARQADEVKGVAQHSTGMGVLYSMGRGDMNWYDR